DDRLAAARAGLERAPADERKAALRSLRALGPWLGMNLVFVVGVLVVSRFMSRRTAGRSKFAAIVLGWLLSTVGEDGTPEAVEAMVTATVAWLLAVGLAAVPFAGIADVSFIDAYFEAMSGMTTTGMSIFTSLDLPRSVLFWRSFMQWVGGLGILTFFVAVLVESGGVARQLAATEANTMSGGNIRASLFNAIKSLWYVYIVLTAVLMVLLYHFDFPAFHAVTHALATMPTGGFSTVPDLAALMNPGARATLTLFMFLGGTNFLLIYSVLQGNVRRMLGDFEFRLYLGITTLAFLVIAADLVLAQGISPIGAASTAGFHASSVISSAGFGLKPLGAFPDLSRFVFLLMMFVGGSLGSTTGGFKMMRLGIMLKLAVQQVKSVGIPRTVVNPVTVGGRIVRDEEILQVAAILLMWLGAIALGGAVTVWLSPYSITESVQLMTSAVGTMGPTFIPQAELTSLHPLVKISLMVGMLAGRLEMLPLLGILNIRLVQKFA
ncbi:MAG: potassium transporter TrkG, partial [Candidatus Nanohaloarchaea archaeon]|nr:potassium transporter TrkG [Candidatus Nanohaloarchaea archaeon]